MKSFLLFLIALSFHLNLFSQNVAHKLPIIPEPNFIQADPGDFFVSDSTIIIADESLPEAIMLQQFLKSNYDIQVKITSHYPPVKHYIAFLSQLNDGMDPDKESYQMKISKKGVRITTNAPEGLFYAIQSLLQLMPNEGSKRISIPCAQIIDSPRYKWRGMHLDCSRHFFSKDEVKQYIDLLARYKMNVFHWHLTDDQGWRIEIKKYPLLTKTGSMRKQTLIGKPSKANKYDKKPYGGFYSQGDIKEIVSYAASKYITVVPEIEMPGHSLAALAAYPQYSCKGGPFEVGDTWGVYDDVYCAGNDSTFLFLYDVLDEVCDLFPGKYIHIGGDECPKVRWEKCPKCQKRIKDEKLKDEHHLQSYFITRIEKYLNAKGKQIIGWDEILEGGLAPNAAVMSWRGTEGGIAAAKQSHFVVMSPGKPCYFDHYQSRDKAAEPIAIGGFNPLDSVYAYDPTPKVLSPEQAQFIMGAQANVWTEYITSFSQVQYMAVPRMCALAEVLWTKPEQKKYSDFILRLSMHTPYFDKLKLNYAKHAWKK